MLTLARQLGHATDSAQWRKRASENARRAEWERRVRNLRVRAHQEAVEAYQAVMGHYAEVRDTLGEDVDLLERGLMLYADLLHLGAKLLLIEVLPSPELCQFLGASEDYSQRQIAKVISDDGIFLNGKHFELPPVCSPHSTLEVVGVPMPERWTPGTAKGAA
jgi:hypothetical protein